MRLCARHSFLLLFVTLSVSDSATVYQKFTNARFGEGHENPLRGRGRRDAGKRAANALIALACHEGLQRKPECALVGRLKTRRRCSGRDFRFIPR